MRQKPAGHRPTRRSPARARTCLRLRILSPGRSRDRAGQEPAENARDQSRSLGWRRPRPMGLEDEYAIPLPAPSPSASKPSRSRCSTSWATTTPRPAGIRSRPERASSSTRMNGWTDRRCTPNRSMLRRGKCGRRRRRASSATRRANSRSSVAESGEEPGTDLPGRRARSGGSSCENARHRLHADPDLRARARSRPAGPVRLPDRRIHLHPEPRAAARGRLRDRPGDAAVAEVRRKCSSRK